MKTTEYYLMRHASYYDKENQHVTYYGMLELKESLDDLFTEITEKFPEKKLRVVHSILPRAKHTTLLIKDILGSKSKKMDVFTTSDPRLNSDKFQIKSNYIQEVVGGCEKENKICLILSHEPDIEAFCDRKLKTSKWIRMTVELKEENIPAENDKDDLPF